MLCAIMFKVFAPSEPAYNPAHCYQQSTDSNCGYYCLRIAAEYFLGDKFKKRSKKIFTRDFLPMCPRNGERLEVSTKEFERLFPALDIHFETDNKPDYSPADVLEKLAEGKILVLNVQNIKFVGNKMKAYTRAKGAKRGVEGHNICCIGGDEEKLIFSDSNWSGKSCRKTMQTDILQVGYEAVHGLTLNPRDRAIAKTTFICEMFWVVAGPPKKTPLRRSRRRR